MKPCVIETPTAGDLAQNLQYLDRCIDWCLAQSFTPYSTLKMLGHSEGTERELRITAGRHMTTALLAQGVDWLVFVDNGTCLEMRRSVAAGRAAGREPRLVLLSLYEADPIQPPTEVATSPTQPTQPILRQLPVPPTPAPQRDEQSVREAVLRVLVRQARPCRLTVRDLRERYPELSTFTQSTVGFILKEWALAEGASTGRMTNGNTRFYDLPAKSIAAKTDVTFATPARAKEVPPAPKPISAKQAAVRIVTCLASGGALEETNAQDATERIFGRPADPTEVLALKQILSGPMAKRRWLFSTHVASGNNTETWTIAPFRGKA